MIDINLKKLVENHPLALATISDDGTPHCIAVAFVKVIDTDKLLITDNYMGTTAKNIQRDNSVALAVWNKDWEENCCGFELLGNAEYFSSGEWLDKVKAFPENKDYPAKGAILVTVKNTKKLA
ncbi:pyridoxamine 5'-phosphate oxidase family protein [Nanoarchaeota archaeon]